MYGDGDLASLWTETVGAPAICVAVLDGPVDLSHPCFEGARLSVTETLVPATADQGPASQHGTHVASVIFGRYGGPVPGIAPGCRGLIVPIFKSGKGGALAACSQIDLARAITQAVQQGAHVINISGGQLDPGGEAHPLLTRAVQWCADEDVVIVAAAGNDGCSCLHVPAAIPSVLAVGAMDAQGQPLDFSNWGEAYLRQGVLAQGESIVGALPGGGTVTRGGTSWATAVVSGVVALLLSLQLKRGQRPDPPAVRNAILASAVGCNVQPAPDCRRLLAGRLDVPGALAYLNLGGLMEVSDNTTDPDVPEVEAQEEPSLVPEAGSEPAPAVRGAEAAQPTVQPAAKTRPTPPWIPAAAPTATPPPALSSDRVTASGCADGTCGAPALVYALGDVGYDFGTEARRDSFIQHGIDNPHDPTAILRHLESEPANATALTWTLSQETTPIYALRPGGAFAAEVYARLRQFLQEQLTEGAERVSIPGYVGGSVTLMNGHTVPVIWPELRGMYSWSTPALVEAVLGKKPAKKEDQAGYEEKAADIVNFLERIYYEIRNLGLTPQERAMNYAATNAFQIEFVFASAIQGGLSLDSIAVERSPICRPESDCWDVKLTFFHPTKRQEQARAVYRFTVDVSDVVPVTVGKVRHWNVY